ncbi:hypothetical protein OW521_17545 [Arthrobacter sp. MMS18-M83]|nr:hypothetical protein OW521_17545 [Arthrobacter sp. MMS18-M83]
MAHTTNEPQGSILGAPLETGAIANVRSAPASSGGFLARTVDNLQYVRGRGALEIGIIFVVLIAAFSIASLASPTTFPFLSQQNLSAVISQAVPVFGILGIGAGILMVAGEFDLSLGANVGFSAIVFIRTSESFGWGWGIPAALLTAIGIALLNGLIVVITRIPSFIATLGMGFFWVGGAIFVNGTIAPLSPRDRARTPRSSPYLRETTASSAPSSSGSLSSAWRPGSSSTVTVAATTSSLSAAIRRPPRRSRSTRCSSS